MKKYLVLFPTHPAFRMNDGAGNDTTHPFVAFSVGLPTVKSKAQ